MVLRIFWFNFIFCVIIYHYFIDIWFVLILLTFDFLLALLRCGIIRHLVAVVYSCEGDSYRQYRLEQYVF